jgi:hypothetical protein
MVNTDGGGTRVFRRERAESGRHRRAGARRAHQVRLRCRRGGATCAAPKIALDGVNDGGLGEGGAAPDDG